MYTCDFTVALALLQRGLVYLHRVQPTVAVYMMFPAGFSFGNAVRTCQPSVMLSSLIVARYDSSGAAGAWGAVAQSSSCFQSHMGLGLSIIQHRSSGGRSRLHGSCKSHPTGCCNSRVHCMPWHCHQACLVRMHGAAVPLALDALPVM